MATLYDYEDDPLDGPIAALEGVDRGVQRYNAGMRDNRDFAAQRAERAAQIHEVALRTKLAQDEQNFKMQQSQADSQGMQKTLDALYTPPAGGPQGPMPNGDTAQGAMSGVPFESRQAIAGLHGLQGMSPHGRALAAQLVGQHAKTNVDKRNKAMLLEDIGKWAAPDPNAPATQGPKSSEAPDGGDLWSGWMDPKEHAALQQRINDPNTSAHDAESMVEKYRGKRATDIAAEEFKQNAGADLQGAFDSFMNVERPAFEKAGYQIEPAKVMLARVLMHQLMSRKVRDPNQLAQDQQEVMKVLYSAVSQPRVGRGTSGSGRAPTKGSAEHYELMRTDPTAHEEMLVDRATKLFPETDTVGRQKYVEDGMAKFRAQQPDTTDAARFANNPIGALDPFGGRPPIEDNPVARITPEKIAATEQELGPIVAQTKDMSVEQIRALAYSKLGMAPPKGPKKKRDPIAESLGMDDIGASETGRYDELLKEWETNPPPARKIAIKKEMRALRGVK